MPKNGLTPTAGTTDEWISPHLDEERLCVITLTSKKKEEPIRYFRTKFFLE